MIRQNLLWGSFFFFVVCVWSDPFVYTQDKRNKSFKLMMIFESGYDDLTMEEKGHFEVWDAVSG